MKNEPQEPYTIFTDASSAGSSWNEDLPSFVANVLQNNEKAKINGEDYKIFKTIAVSIVVELASEQGSVHTQIPIAHRLEEKAECLEIVNQILWPKAERGCGY